MPIEPHLDRVLRLIRENIASGEWPPGHKLPTHQQLAADWGVGMTTIRQAVRLLKEAGTLDGHQGVGVFVAEKK
ncbi:winged helix-turn-helix domain-containing protein [Catellatospora sp. NPDC049133]|jgi:GntR family transcriptional regulator|uniref:winged helix-turn-helix domain-containing protein n=1 Tax=Catellatospora sp. NPDC049133 TaxID=3155499 RepID=UPI00340FEB74